MYLAYIPEKDGRPLEPKVIEGNPDYIEGLKVGEFSSELEAIYAVHEYWFLYTYVDEHGTVRWVYD